MKKLSEIYCTLFFIGYFKWIPGTFASVVSIIVILIIYKLLNNLQFILLFIFLSVLAFKFIDIFSRYIENHDAREIVIDEFLGIYLIMFFYNSFDSLNSLIKISLIFFLFRFFDIIKPFPANWIDKNILNSYGIILDDIVAGIYTIIALFFLNVIF